MIIGGVVMVVLIAVAGGIYYVKKLKSSLLALILTLSFVGCVDQSGASNNNDKLTIAATSVAVTEILEALEISADQVIGIPTTEAYSVPKNIKMQPS
ncbi:hypothetical protein SD457_24410 [Coprobacillaceae bacterium CR2/5/TPMF4]|nr:hypothetical protein SD457_24410 [Coprobacillaceae bacterium CR2/5/TPMF4]